jgi:hypothetical protein
MSLQSIKQVINRPTFTVQKVIPVVEIPRSSDSGELGFASKDVMGDWMSGSERAAAYRLHAAHCAEMAQRASDSQARVGFIEMSEAWPRLAELAEKNSKSQRPVAETTGSPQGS